MAINVCNKCYVFELKSSCTNSAESLTINVGLNNTNYTFWMTDKFGNYWLYTNTSSNTGELTFDLAVFPEGMFTEFSGSYEVNVSTSEVSNLLETFTIDTIEYECFIIKFIKTNI